jgi:4-amino-4-deoxy-L-arabinose transferase-like glycosyltransferase
MNGTGTGASFAKPVLLIIAAATAFRLGLAALLPAGIDEAYTVGVARQLSLSYFDHPPLHIWLVWLMRRISDELFVLRLPFVLLGAVSSWLLYVLTRRLFGGAAGLWAVVAFTLTPVFGIAHAGLIFPDGPLIAAALATAVIVAGIVLDSRPEAPPTGRWLLAGLFAGLAVLSKYHGVLLVLGLFLFLVTTREGRRHLATPGPWLAAAIAALGMAPALIWNAQHDWVSFAFQADRRQIGKDFNALGPLQSLVMQFLYLLPWIAISMALVLVRGISSGPKNLRRWLLVCLAIVPVGLFTGLTFVSNGLPHWPMPGWLFAIPLLGEALGSAGRTLRRIGASVAVATAVLVVVVLPVAAVQARWGTFDAQFAVLGEDLTEQLLPWDGLPELLAEQGLTIGENTFIATQNWIWAGHINAVMGDRVPVVCLCRDPRHFQFLNPADVFAGRDAIVIGDSRLVEDDVRLSSYFSDLSDVSTLGLKRGKRVVTTLLVRTGRDFRPGAE